MSQPTFPKSGLLSAVCAVCTHQQPCHEEDQAQAAQQVENDAHEHDEYLDDDALYEKESYQNNDTSNVATGKGTPLTIENLHSHEKSEAAKHFPYPLIFCGPASPPPEQIARANRWGTMHHKLMHFDLTRFADHRELLDVQYGRRPHKERKSLTYIDPRVLGRNPEDYSRYGIVEEYTSVAGRIQNVARRVMQWLRK
jgi:hypothetical protein